MIVLDENIVASQRDQLRIWGIHFRQIGQEIGRKGMDDMEEIIPLLHKLPTPTFFTRDTDFYRSDLCHAGYCLIVLAVRRNETALYLRRLLRHPEFDTRAKRMGRVVRVSSAGIVYRERQADQERAVPWPQRGVRP